MPYSMSLHHKNQPRCCNRISTSQMKPDTWTLIVKRYSTIATLTYLQLATAHQRPIQKRWLLLVDIIFNIISANFTFN